MQKRILDIAFVRDRIEFIEGDGMDVLTAMSRVSNAAFFIDPPYTAAGKRAGTRLYKHNELDHERLFQIAESLQSDFLMTYDNNEEVAALARRYSFDALAVPMKNTHHTTMTELLIGKNLDWARR